MAIPSSFGVILYVAMHAGQPCELVFRDLAKAVGYAGKEWSEQRLMSEFADAACATSNPDIFWQIAFQESSFRFELVRENIGPGLANIYEGDGALRMLRTLTTRDQSRNIDLGVMQFNWAWHHQGFGDDPMLALSPKASVKYFMKSFGGEIFDRCRGRWVGCYHSTNDKSRAQKYEQEVLEKGRLLRLEALRYLRKSRSTLAAEKRKALPPILQEDMDKLLAFAREIPLPQNRS